MRRFALFVLILTATGAAAADRESSRSPPSSTTAAELRVGDLPRAYYLHVPKLSRADRASALVIVLHGGGGTARGTERLTRFSELSDRVGFLVAYPEGIGKSWNDGRETTASKAHREKIDDVAFIAAMIDDIAKRYRLDPRRVYATGISNGAIFAHYLAAHLSARIAAIAPVVGGIADPFDKQFKPAEPVSVFILQGTDDPLVPYGGGDIVAWGKRGRIVSTDQTVQLWVAHDACATEPRRQTLADNDPSDDCRVSVSTWSKCRAGTEVVLYALEGAGHTWPGGAQYLPQRLIGKVCRDIDATEAIWNFFDAHPKR